MFKGVKQSVIRGELPIIQSLEHGYSQSVEEGNVQLGGAVGNFGGNILGGIAMGAAFGGGATIETGPGAAIGALVGGIVGGMLGEPAVEAMVRNLQTTDITSPTITVSVGAGRGVRPQTIANPNYVGPYGYDSPSEHHLPAAPSPNYVDTSIYHGSQYNGPQDRLPSGQNGYRPSFNDSPSEYNHNPHLAPSTNSTGNNIHGTNTGPQGPKNYGDTPLNYKTTEPALRPLTLPTLSPTGRGN